MSKFKVNDVLRIMEAVQKEETRLDENPFATKLVKDYALTVWWPHIHMVFYPDGMTWEDRLKEVYLLEEFKLIWSQTAVGMILDIIQAFLGLSDEDLEGIRDSLIELIADLLKKFL